MVVRAVLLLAAATLPAARAQQVIRSTTRLVQVSVVATGKSNRALTDLRADDFTLTDNGVARPISVFLADTAPARTAPSAPPPGTFTNRFPRGGYCVILLDWRNTEFGDRAQARRQVLQMLAQIDTTDRIALFVLDRNLRSIEDFGAGRAAFLRRLNAAGSGAAAAAGDAASPYDASLRGIESEIFDPAPPNGPPWARLSMEERIRELDLRIRDTLAALAAIGRYLAGVQGRKSLIWVSAGIPTSIDGSVVRGAKPGERTYSDEIERAVRALNQADVAVYPIDARGLSISSGAYINIATMRLFAQRTGGTAWVNRNDLGPGLRAALDDQRVSYTLGFYAPDKPSSDSPHHIRIRVRQPGTTLRYRDTYFAAAPPPSPSELLASPTDSSGLPVTVQATRRPGALDLAVMLDPTTLTLNQSAGRWRGSVELVARFLDAAGAFAGDGMHQEVAFDLFPRVHDAALQHGLRFQRTLPIPVGAARLRLLIRDSAGPAGTLTIPLDRVSPLAN
ncbi:MAG: VWA domain-containing protein [Acidobacteria bacterium]|nr:VWA domain-containing protein [Acidobacteriota bacterium]